MKKVFVLSLLCMIALSINAQEKKDSYFGWNQSVGISVGYAYDHGIFGSSEIAEGFKMPRTDMLECDLNLYGFFVGMGFDLNARNEAFYPYHKHNTLHSIKFGASLVYGIDRDNRFIFTPYLGYVKNKNSIEFYEKTVGKYIWGHERKFIYGAKVQYAYKLLEVGAFSSNRESGVTIGLNLNCKPKNKQ